MNGMSLGDVNARGMTKEKLLAYCNENNLAVRNTSLSVLRTAVRTHLRAANTLCDLGSTVDYSMSSPSASPQRQRIESFDVQTLMLNGYRAISTISAQHRTGQEKYGIDECKAVVDKFCEQFNLPPIAVISAEKSQFISTLSIMIAEQIPLQELLFYLYSFHRSHVGVPYDIDLVIESTLTYAGLVGRLEYSKQ